MDRKGRVERKTKETDSKVELELDGSGKAEVETGMPFLNHMLDSFSRHGLFDLKLKTKGDIEVDYHHTVEDVGLALGQAFKESLGDKQGRSEERRVGKECRERGKAEQSGEK